MLRQGCSPWGTTRPRWGHDVDVVRRPPTFVPTLTDVVQRPAPAAVWPDVPPPLPEAVSGPEGELQQQIDAAMASALESLQPRLRELVQLRLNAWVERELPQLAQEVAQSLLDEVAVTYRAAVERALPTTGRMARRQESL